MARSPLDLVTGALASPVWVRAGEGTTTVSDAYLHSSNLTDVALYYTVHAIPQVYNPGIIVASIAVAILGSYSTLLLLGKRTSNKGARNITLLVMAASVMACVGIWGMHFIGMHFSLRPIPNVSWYVQFSPGFTVFSLFVPTISLVIAFFFVDDVVSFSMWRVCLSGVITGLIVSLMHYSASFKANFVVTYNPIHTSFSILLGCVAATIALFSFFRFRAQWEDSWWKRLVCATILGAGVSGMHYLGAAGTSYYVPPDPTAVPGILSTGSYQSNVVTIAIGVMCFAIIVFSTFIPVSDVLTARDARNKARKVVVCSATFDKQGRLLVKQDGTMPMMVIETQIQIKDMLDYLDNRQPTFQWLYSISWDWNIVAPFLRAITAFFFAKDQEEQRRASQRHSGGGAGLFKVKALNKSRRSIDALSSMPNKGPAALAEFRDRFIDAANHLSFELDIPLQQIGVLYDRVFPTGTRKVALQAANNGHEFKPHRETLERFDDESSINGHVPSIFGDGENEEEGLMLFLVRELPGSSGAKDAAENAEKYRQRGYRMTETRFLAGVLADRVAVTKPEMEVMLDSLRLYAKRGTRPVVQPGGVYAGLFGVRPSTSRQGGLDVLVYNFARHQIPAYRLPDVAKITPDMRVFLRMLDQMTMEEAMKVCERESIRSGEQRRYVNGLATAQQQDAKGDIAATDDENVELMIQFQTALFIALDALHNSVRFYPRIAQTARISAEVLEVPSTLDDSTAPAEMILIQAVLPEARVSPNSYSELVNAAAAETVPTDRPGNGTPFVFTPYTLFSKSQMMLLRGRQADDFEHEVVIELRRRYPSSLMQEAEERASDHQSRKTHSVISHDISYLQVDEKKYGDEDDYGADDHASGHNIGGGSGGSNKGGFSTRWGNRSKQQQRGKQGEYYHSESFALSPRRNSSSSAVSRTGPGHSARTPPMDQKEMRQVTHAGLTPLRADNSNNPQSPISPSSTVTAVNSPDRLPEYSQADHDVHASQSLGIRRFIDGGLPANALSALANARYAQPADETIVEEDMSQNDDQQQLTSAAAAPVGISDLSSDDGRSICDASSAADLSARAPAVVRKRPGVMPPAVGGLAAAAPIYESATTASRGSTNASRRRPATAAAGSGTGSASTAGVEPLGSLVAPPPRIMRSSSGGPRPSTAPSSGRRETALLRPRTADSAGNGSSSSNARFLSQRHAASASLSANEASLLARLRSDDWSTRQLQSLERGPSGQLLLGVDF
ncbi:hypothetical protein K437DRAFT_164180 [Tilletiaria anomala UBC 951]|uniref:MHYT domain-containing protein n=1 Tax=Tilletiaria anomala (strain ATCC 24038 / CBS 436.72 / UBC 951) TaxID=1037660 RepID=A0A066VLR1_TILAU|nr:uncharacterized protein K437DRAFT_164180 [Tilletiaria anomala UBC 951]KDN42391.1 hypothetical protein K437DRAFT_164180 [Tilletiaria anomala UBC 951]